MKKFVFLLLLGFVFPLVYVNGQDDCSLYNVYRVGSSFKMVHYDKKGKASGVTETTIASLDKIPKGFSMVFRQKFSNLEDYSFENEYESRVGPLLPDDETEENCSPFAEEDDSFLADLYRLLEKIQ